MTDVGHVKTLAVCDSSTSTSVVVQTATHCIDAYFAANCCETDAATQMIHVFVICVKFMTKSDQE